MCIITTSYPCPEGNLAELLQRINNTRKIVPCDTVSSPDGRPLSCVGEMKVQHHLLGESKSCPSCSLAAKAAYAEMREEPEKKRKAGCAVVDEEGKNGEEERMAKKAKVGESSGAFEAPAEDGHREVGEQDGWVYGDAVSEANQTKLVGFATKVVGTEDLTEEQVAGLEGTADVDAAISSLTEAFNVTDKRAEATNDSARVISEVRKRREEQQAAVPLPGPKSAAEMCGEVQTGEEAENTARVSTLAKLTPPTTPVVKKDKAMAGNGPKAAVSKVCTTKAPGAEHSGLSDFEQVQSLILKMNQKQIKAEKDRDDLLKRNATLVAQITQHQDEISALKTRLLQQNAQHQTEMEKQRGAGKDVDSEKAATELEKQDLEAKVGRLMQENGELVKSASTATEETNAVKARVRGQQNRVAELEGQMAIMKQVEDGRRKQLEEARGQGESLQRQIIGFRTKTAGFEAENARLKQEMAAVEEENVQLRAAVVQRVLSSPMSQGPGPSPAPAQAPADDSVVKSQKDVKVEE